MLDVLLVDDDPLTLAILRACARRTGYRDVCAASGREATQLLATGLRPALIVTDIEMAEMNGIELIRHVRDDVKLPKTPIIAFSSATRPPDNAGADLWVSKSGLTALITALQEFRSASGRCLAQGAGDVPRWPQPAPS
jgi:CheY-like chemotaxis protein